MFAWTDIRISKDSEVTLRQQLVEQITFLIVTGKLRPGEPLPSVRELARRLRIHRNTASQAYRDLAGRDWLARRRGSRMVVRSPESVTRTQRDKDLDDLINATIRAAQERGFTLQQLRQRVRERLMTQPPDHLLVVDPENGMRELMRKELKDKLPFPVEACSPIELSSNHGLAIGALIVTTPGAMPEVAPLLPKDRTPFPITFCTVDEHVEVIRRLREPSMIAVVSVSQRFLDAARGLLAPLVGRRHTMRGYFLPEEKPGDLRAADVVFCDSIAYRQVKAAKLVHYRLISSACLERISSAMKS